MDFRIPIPTANIEVVNENQWTSKLITYWLTYLLFSLTTLTGKKYMNVYSKDLAEFLPLLLTITIMSFLITNFKPNSCLQTMLIVTGIFCTNIFVLSGLIPYDHPMALLDYVLMFVFAALPLWPYLIAATAPGPYQINTSVERLLSRGWRVKTVMISMIGGAKLDSKEVVSALNAYAIVAYMLFQLATFFLSDPVTTLWFISIAWLSLVPIVLTILLRTNFLNLTNGAVCLISVSACLPLMLLKLLLWKAISNF